MSNVIEFLEKIGKNASLRYAQNHELEHELAGTQVEPSIRVAIMNGRQCELEALLGATANVFCGMHPAKD